MSKSRPQVKEKLKGWYDWLANHILEPIKERASRAFKTCKDKIMGLYERFKGKEPKEKQNEEGEQNEESFNPVGLEQAFGRAYRNSRINGRSRMDIDTLFDRIRQNHIELISRELTELDLARVQTTTWIRFKIEYEEGIIDRVKLQLHDAIYRLRFYSNSLIHILSLSNSHNNVASIQKNRGDKSHRVIVALGYPSMVG